MCHRYQTSCTLSASRGIGNAGTRPSEIRQDALGPVTAGVKPTNGLVMDMFTLMTLKVMASVRCMPTEASWFELLISPFVD